MCPIFMQIVKALMNLLMYILVETIKHLINFYSIKQIGVIYLCVCVLSLRSFQVVVPSVTDH